MPEHAWQSIDDSIANDGLFIAGSALVSGRNWPLIILSAVTWGVKSRIPVGIHINRPCECGGESDRKRVR